MSEKRVGKRFLTWVLALVMTLSLLPMNVLAADPETDGDLHFKKTAELDPQTGDINVRMEAWATGEVTTSTSTEALDIALVLDVSGSMKEDFIQEEENFIRVYEKDLVKGETYYVKPLLIYHEVSWCDKCEDWTSGCWNLGKLHIGGFSFNPKAKESFEVLHSQFYEYQYTSGQSKLDALKEAVNDFIDDVTKKSPNSQIAIVKFAGDKSDSVGNDTYGSYNYTQIVTKLTEVNESGVTKLKDAVNDLNYGGATAADYGMEKAQKALEGARENSKKVVVLFTDGEPNHQNGFDYSVAANTVNKAKEMKTDDTTIYTIGVFREQDDDVDRYMSSTSSNHPNASAITQDRDPYWEVFEGGSEPGDYYMQVNDKKDLLKAFETISSEVITGTALDGTAVLTDVIAPNCSLVIPEGTNGITAYTVDKTATGWSESQTPLTNGVTVSGKEVQVTGFDYSANCVTDTPKPSTNDYGKKLVVEFKVQNDNYGGTQPTNSNAFISDGNGNHVKTADEPCPEVAAPVKLPAEAKNYTDSKVYDGEGYDIKANIAGLVAGLVPVDGEKNKYVDLTYTIKDSNGNLVGTYTILHDQTTGTWADGTSDIKTPADVGEYTYTVTVTGTDKDKSKTDNFDSKDYTAKFSITAKPVTFTGETASKQWTGSEQSIAGITVDGLVTGHTYKGLTYCAKGTAPGPYNGEFSGDLVIKDADGNVVTTNYQVTKTPGTLTITNSTSTATVTFKIDGGTWTDGKTDDKTVQVTLTNGMGTLAGVTIPNGTADNGHEGEGVWKDASGNEVSLSTATTITGDTAYTLTFAAKTPAVKHTLTINYTGPDDGVFEAPKPHTEQLVKDATYNVPSPPIPGYTPDQKSVSGTMGAENVTVTVTYTKNAPTPGTFDFDDIDDIDGKETPAITKTVKGNVGKNFKETFEVAVKPKSENATGTMSFARYTGKAEVTYTDGLKNVPFRFKPEAVANTSIPYGELRFTEAGIYTYTVKEIPGKTGRMSYDTTEYTLTIEVGLDKEANAYKVESWKFDANKEAGAPLNIVNTYRTYRPSTPTVEIEDDDALGLNTTGHFAYIVGYGNGEVRPQNNITRAEVATIFFRLLTDDVRDENLTKINRYSDVAASSWYNTAVSTLSSMGIITGYPDGTFRPNAAITRAEFAAIAARFDTNGDKTTAKFSDIAAHWARDEISIAYNNGWITGYPDGTFRPQRDITRAETVTLVNRVLNRLPETEDDLLPDMVTWTDNANPNAWYYLAVQEATNNHYYKFKTNSKYEKWTELRETRDWAKLEK